MECRDCHADDEILITCGDRKLRCAPCAAAAGYCMSCGRRSREPICVQCEVTADDKEKYGSAMTDAERREGIAEINP